MSRRGRFPWGVVLTLGAVGIGTVVLVKRASAKEEAQPLPPAATTDPFLALVTDPNAVRALQQFVAAEFEGQAAAGVQRSPDKLSIRDYNYSDVDGNPRSTRWMRVVAWFQNDINPLISEAIARPDSKIPKGFPIQLRTDGVLDEATAWAMRKA